MYHTIVLNYLFIFETEEAIFSTRGRSAFGGNYNNMDEATIAETIILKNGGVFWTKSLPR
jgi:hypothetical protein